jgi:hypothetical protein
MAIKMYQMDVDSPNSHKIYQHFIWNVMPSKIYPSWDFWYEKGVPSGSPGRRSLTGLNKKRLRADIFQAAD